MRCSTWVGPAAAGAVGGVAVVVALWRWALYVDARARRATVEQLATAIY